MAKSKIEWTDAVWNPVTGCTKVSAGCAHCYAERMSKRLAGRCGYPKDEPFKVTLHPDKLDEPLKWKRPRRIFVNSMGDLFHKDVPATFIADVFDVMRQAKQHTFMILTKRPEGMKWLRLNGPIYNNEPLPNVWLGVSVENQAAADERIPLLLQTSAAVRFISAEPLLGPISLWPWLSNPSLAALEFGKEPPLLDWVIVGGESGPGARPLHPDWARNLRDQCQSAEVPFFFKSWGEWIVPEDGAEACRVCGCTWHNACDGGCYWVEPGLCSNCVGKPVPKFRAVKFRRVGKKKAGRMLNGREWDEIPEVQRWVSRAQTVVAPT